MVDIMNHIWTRGTDSRKGNTIFLLTVAKLNNFLRPWLTGTRGKSVRQLHLHIDDPGNTIPQKRGEKARRDNLRTANGDEESIIPPLHEPLEVPWSSMVASRRNRDMLASVHLFCGAVAAMEPANETGSDLRVFLYGGCFTISSSIIGAAPKDILPHLSPQDVQKAEEIALMPRNGTTSSEEYDEKQTFADFCSVPRCQVLCLSSSKGFQFHGIDIRHGESETGMVAAYNTIVLPELVHWDATARTSSIKSSCVVISNDTDVTIILGLAECMRNKNVYHVLSNTVLSIDNIWERALKMKLSFTSLACIYVFAGCDFTPGTSGISHELYLRAYIQQMVVLGNLNETTTCQKYETLMLLSYLAKFGISDMRSIQEKAELAAQLKKRCHDGEMTDINRVMLLKKVWVSVLKVGTKGWSLDARRFVADRVKSVADLVPASEHIQLQGFRTKFVVFQYWKHAFNCDLSPSKVGGSQLDCGYSIEGVILIERDEDVRVLQKTIDGCVTLCRCRGDCSTRKCSCKNRHGLNWMHLQ